MTNPKPFWRRPFNFFLGRVVLIFAVLYLLAQSALSDLDARVTSGRDDGAPLPWAKAQSLFLISQVLPLWQPGASTVAPGKVFTDCPDCPKMVEIPAGYYLIGSPLFEGGRYQQFFGRHPIRAQFQYLNREGPRRLVHIAKPFALSQYEVTFAQWDAAQDDPEWETLTGRAPRKPLFGPGDFSNRAVTQVDQNDAHAFATWLSHKTGQHYRIPSEAEWEYAARAGTTTRYPWGNDIGVNNAACLGCSDTWKEMRIGPVGMFPPNGFGLYDMIGNGWEWVEDCFTASHPAAISHGSAYKFPNCELVVFKGGTAFSTPWQNRSAMRVGPHPYNNGEGSTIRLLRELD